ncbi:uncharacterized protein QC761_0024940 [Podospora bellae-mahoneyi]|uniref:MARVEL domain-containing protein n=1 Tax=Podospora bellae-mahoneyi TaxID=2093777 RepID=A0ABR0FW03_9PEZI|nr:hypothetical protein QC761_0024940 [Podospora bellae-mahoneyi]
MARDRLPSKFAIVLTALHSLSLLACFTSIISSAVSAAQIPEEAVTTTGAFVASFWTIGEDIAEIAALANARIRRCPAKWLYILELVTAIFCFALPAASSLGYEAAMYERCRYVSYKDEEKFACRRSAGPMETAATVAMAGVYLAATIHTILFFLTVIQYCVMKRKTT